MRRRRCGTSSSTGRSAGRATRRSCPGVSSASRLHQVDLGADGDRRPGGRGLDRLDDVVGRPDLVGELARPRGAHSGWATTMPSGCSARNAATCSGRKRWWTEQWPFHSRNVASLQSASVSPPSSSRGFHTRMSSCVVAQGEAGVAAEVLVGEEQHLVRPCAVPSAHSRTARALVEVHTAPPCSPDERLQRGRRVHVGDRHEPVDVDDAGRAPPTPPRPRRCRPCRPSSSRR